MALTQFKVNKISYYTIFFITGVYLVFFQLFENYKNPKFINYDAVSYYSYLPAIFIHHDIKLTFTGGEYTDHFWPDKAPNGGNVIKTTCGMAILYSPFFFTGHLLANILDYEASGFTLPYGVCLYFGTIFYVFIGLFFLRKVLLYYFEDKYVALTLFTLCLGTNLFYQSVYEALITHAYNFTLSSIFLYLIIKWHEKPLFSNSLFLGLVGGLMVLIRPTNVMIALLFILYGISSIASLKSKLKLIFTNSHYLILMVVAGFCMLIPQLLYWQYVTGSWHYYSYGNERFFFTNPHIIEGLFSYRKGWLLYTPMMCFSLAGILLLRKALPQYFLAISIFMIIFIYITFSWWCWWYGGVFGMRPFVDFYPFLAIPLCLFFKTFLVKRKVAVPLLTICAFFVYVNIFQTNQYKEGYLHWDAVSSKTYWQSFLVNKRYNQYDLKCPSYHNASKGIDEY